ncbi:hypothetical protein CYLTODRAFT_426824 [Cylindrobasidium torrendii FP15055 ss-10]|uniref:Uncharacterized protein n=1 Tax=Cylindrobasidium torrendii FP15055 ss-10 TaxID=1314674 RepID=A0A0D7AWE5_9AGAR|nr:hypothetical protein CYLTODRAFT_426824 [Cylindrobasidium torrendii FP15055 ss-10]
MMRAAIKVYEHPTLTASEVWSKGDSTSAASEASISTILKTLGAISVATATAAYGALTYTSLGDVVQTRCA